MVCFCLCGAIWWPTFTWWSAYSACIVPWLLQTANFATKIDLHGHMVPHSEGGQVFKIHQMQCFLSQTLQQFQMVLIWILRWPDLCGYVEINKINIVRSIWGRVTHSQTIRTFQNCFRVRKLCGVYVVKFLLKFESLLSTFVFDVMPQAMSLETWWWMVSFDSQILT